jgi:hypothetical protein
MHENSLSHTDHAGLRDYLLNSGSMGALSADVVHASLQ